MTLAVGRSLSKSAKVHLSGIALIAVTVGSRTSANIRTSNLVVALSSIAVALSLIPLPWLGTTVQTALFFVAAFTLFGGMVWRAIYVIRSLRTI